MSDRMATLSPEERELLVKADDENDHGDEYHGDYGNNDEQDIEAPEQEYDTASESEMPEESEQGQEEAPKINRQRFREPTPEELKELRKETIHHEQRMRDFIEYKSEKHENPKKYIAGQIKASSANIFKDLGEAKRSLRNSDDYKNASPKEKIIMEGKLVKEWHGANKNKISEAIKHNAEIASGAHEANKQHQLNVNEKLLAAVDHASPSGEVSAEAAAQHIGGSKDAESGATQVTIKKNPVSSFMESKGQDFIDKLKQKTSREAGEVEVDYTPKKTFEEVYGKGHPRSSAYEKFVEHYSPLIHISAMKTMRGLNLDPKKNPDLVDDLTEHGMLGLLSSINKYDHNHESGISFVSHAVGNMTNRMKSHLSNIDPLKHVRAEYKQHQKEPTSPSKPLNVGEPQQEVKLPEPVAPPASSMPAQEVKPAEPAAPAAPAKPKVIRRSADVAARHSKETAERLKRIDSLKQHSSSDDESEG